MSAQNTTSPRVPKGSNKPHQSRKHTRHHVTASSDSKNTEHSPSATANSMSEDNMKSTTSSWDYPAPTSWGNTSITTATDPQHGSSDDMDNAGFILEYQSTVAYDLTGIGSWIPADLLDGPALPHNQGASENVTSVHHSFANENQQPGYWATERPEEAGDPDAGNTDAGNMQTYEGVDTKAQG